MYKRNLMFIRFIRTCTLLRYNSILHINRQLRYWLYLYGSYWFYIIYGRRFYKYNTRLNNIRSAITRLDTIIHNTVNLHFTDIGHNVFTTHVRYRKRRSNIERRRIYRYTYIRATTRLDMLRGPGYTTLQIYNAPNIRIYKRGRLFGYKLGTDALYNLIVDYDDSSIIRWLHVYDLTGSSGRYFQRIFRSLWSARLRTKFATRLHLSGKVVVYLRRRVTATRHAGILDRRIISTQRDVCNFIGTVSFDRSCYTLAVAINFLFKDIGGNFGILPNVANTALNMEIFSKTNATRFNRQIYTVYMALRQVKIWYGLLYDGTYSTSRYNYKRMYKYYSKHDRGKPRDQRISTVGGIQNYEYTHYGLRNIHGYHSYLYTNINNWYRWLMPTVGYIGVLGNFTYLLDEVPFSATFNNNIRYWFNNSRILYKLVDCVYRFNPLDIYIYITCSLYTTYTVGIVYTCCVNNINLIKTQYMHVVFDTLSAVGGVSIQYNQKLLL